MVSIPTWFYQLPHEDFCGRFSVLAIKGSIPTWFYQLPHAKWNMYTLSRYIAFQSQPGSISYLTIQQDATTTTNVFSFNPNLVLSATSRKPKLSQGSMHL